MKKLIALMLVLAMTFALAACGCEHEFAAADCVNPATCTLCGETEGAPLGHVWMAATCETPKTCEVCGAADGEAKGHAMAEATCEEAKHCENCSLTEGEALGHSWVDATTEAPKTCENCGLTEGERIVTDPRFTTAATKDLHGKWCMDFPVDEEMLGIPGFPDGASIHFIVTFCNDGKIAFTAEITESFMEGLKTYTIESVYLELEAEGIDRETADALFPEEVGMTIPEYVETELASVDFDELYGSLFDALDISGAYYVQDGLLYTADSWDAEFVGESFTLDGDTLKVESMDFANGMDSVFVRVIEE